MCFIICSPDRAETGRRHYHSAASTGNKEGVCLQVGVDPTFGEQMGMETGKEMGKETEKGMQVPETTGVCKQVTAAQRIVPHSQQERDTAPGLQHDEE